MKKKLFIFFSLLLIFLVPSFVVASGEVGITKLRSLISSNLNIFDINNLIANYSGQIALENPSSVTATVVLNARQDPPVSCSQLCVNRGYTGCASIGTNTNADNTKFSGPNGSTCSIYAGYACDMVMEAGWPLLDCQSGEPGETALHPSNWTNCLCYTGAFPTPIPTPTPVPPNYNLPNPHYDTHIPINEGYGTCETLCRDLGYLGNGSQSCSTFGLDTNATNGHQCESNMYNACDNFDNTTYGYGANCSYFSMAPSAYGPNNCGDVCGTDRYGQTHNTVWTQCNCTPPVLQLSTPTGLVLSQNNIIVTARWDAVTNATGYQIWSNTSPNSTGATLVGYTNNPYYYLTSTIGSTRYFAIRATFKSVIYSSYSTWLRPTVIVTPTPMPTPTSTPTPTPTTTPTFDSNFGFELGILTNWNGGIQVVNTIKHTGNYSGRVIVSGTTTASFGSDYNSLISIQPGAGYTLSYWYNVASVGSEGAAWTCKAYYRDANKNALVYESCGVNQTGVTGGWVNKIVNLTGHPNARYLEIWFQQIWDRAGGSASVYYDDFSLVTSP